MGDLWDGESGLTWCNLWKNWLVKQKPKEAVLLLLLLYRKRLTWHLVVVELNQCQLQHSGYRDGPRPGEQVQFLLTSDKGSWQKLDSKPQKNRSQVNIHLEGEYTKLNSIFLTVIL